MSRIILWADVVFVTVVLICGALSIIKIDNYYKRRQKALDEWYQQEMEWLKQQGAERESKKMIKEYIVKKSIGNHSGRVFSQKEVGELVRCKDCKYWKAKPNDDEEDNINNGWCKHSNDDRCCFICGNGNSYCSFGERKEAEHDERTSN